MPDTTPRSHNTIMSRDTSEIVAKLRGDVRWGAHLETRLVSNALLNQAADALEEANRQHKADRDEAESLARRVGELLAELRAIRLAAQKGRDSEVPYSHLRTIEERVTAALEQSP